IDAATTHAPIRGIGAKLRVSKHCPRFMTPHQPLLRHCPSFLPASNFEVTPARAIMFPNMKSRIQKAGTIVTVSLAALFLTLPVPSLAQPQARRLILKDGTYQSVTKYEIHGERVRYFSAERGEWEEVPKSLIDWDATDKFEQGREEGKLSPEAAELDKELEAERKAEQARSPQV